MTDKNKSLPVSIHDENRVIISPDNPLPVVHVGSAADKDWDDLVLTRDPVTQDITTATFKKGGNTVRVLTFVYDVSLNLTEVIKS